MSTCQVCGEPVERVFHPVAVHFKGSGFYTTDYARKAGAKASDSNDGKPAKDAGRRTRRRRRRIARTKKAPSKDVGETRPTGGSWRMRKNEPTARS